MEILGGLAFFLALIAIYFLPWIMALKRNHSKKDSIMVINLFLGWAVIPWVLCLAWSFSEQSPRGKSENNHETILTNQARGN